MLPRPARSALLRREPRHQDHAPGVNYGCVGGRSGRRCPSPIEVGLGRWLFAPALSRRCPRSIRSALSLPQLNGQHQNVGAAGLRISLIVGPPLPHLLPPSRIRHASAERPLRPSVHRRAWRRITAVVTALWQASGCHRDRQSLARGDPAADSVPGRAESRIWRHRCSGCPDG